MRSGDNRGKTKGFHEWGGEIVTGSTPPSYTTLESPREILKTLIPSLYPQRFCLNLCRMEPRRELFSNAFSLLKTIAMKISMDYRSLYFYRFYSEGDEKPLKGSNEKRQDQYFN